ncbi:cytochrome P450 [Xylariaceae sp. FL1272]|nr:cytochrome P450 [Xylariaceae sp. FL1272]
MENWISAAVVSFTLIPLTITIYRITLHPLAQFPGPKFAAITRYYEGYYDVVKNGQYTHKIARLHENYGPIVRISPQELHVNDPSFFSTLYNREGRWNKYDWAYDAHGTPLSTLSAIDHNVHKRRRAAINPFFSKGSVSRRQHIICNRTSLLCQRLDTFTSRDVPLAAALGALAPDIATEFILGKSFENPRAPDFRAGVGNTLQESGAIWRITKHLRWYGSLIQAVPLSFIEKMGDQGIIECPRFVRDMENTAKEIHSSWLQTKGHPSSSDQVKATVIDTILDSDLPPEEKTPERLKDEVITVADAAFETTAYSMCKTLYHIYTDNSILKRLRAELHSHGITGAETATTILADLERCEFLTAVLTEGLRLSPAIATRSARVAIDRDLMYGDWNISAGTPVGMTTLLMHTNPDVYPDAFRFDPVRWLDGSLKANPKATYAPFGHGTRNCVGMQ